MSLEERLNVMGIDSNMEVNGGGEAFLKNGQISKTDNLLVSLVQGLQSNDAKMLNVRKLSLLKIELFKLSSLNVFPFYVKSMCCSIKTKK